MKTILKLSLILFFTVLCFNNGISINENSKSSKELFEVNHKVNRESPVFPQLSYNGDEFSQYNLSVIFNEAASSVTGNLSVNYYNNDPINVTQIPFHLFLSGMQYQYRMGSIEIINVSTLNNPKTTLNFSVNEGSQLLWVNLTSKLEPFNRVFFEIEFTSIIPDGGIDRANSHGSDAGQSRIYKFTSFYPMPCVYDKYDEWNTDPYLSVGDPFYHDMAYYDVIIEAPNGMVITATGSLIEKINKGDTTIYHFDPIFPVREVTFAASRWYQVQSDIVNGVNISTYYIPKSSFLWENSALNYAKLAFDLFNDTFGYYPYATLNIVEEYAFYGGMEYPAQVYVSERIDNYNYPINILKRILEKVVVHEIAHQWWYNLVGFDEIDWGFLDEGLTCWSTDYYARFYYNDWTRFQMDTRYFDEVRTYYAREHLPSKINQSAYEIIEDNLNWIYISYYKSPLIFEKIYRIIGESNFLLGLNTFFKQYKNKIALLSNFKNVLEDIIGESLNWLFLPWFDNCFIPNYRFLTCTYHENEARLTVTIEDQNEIFNDYPYVQQARFQVYDSTYSLIYNQLVWLNSTTTFSLLLIDPMMARLVYGNDVIVQLTSPSATYIETTVQRAPEYILISGYLISFTFLVSLLSVIILIYELLIKKKNYSKI